MSYTADGREITIGMIVDWGGDPHKVVAANSRDDVVVQDEFGNFFVVEEPGELLGDSWEILKRDALLDRDEYCEKYHVDDWYADLVRRLRDVARMEDEAA